MDSERLLEELTLYEALPEAAIREAAERRAEILPVFHRTIEDFLDDEDPVPELPTPLFMIFHILGSWREKSAYRLIARFLMSDPERLDWELGDALTMTVPRVMLNLFDGDQQPIRNIIECEAADQYIRAEMFEVLATLAYRGDVSKDSVAAYLRDAHSFLRPQGKHHVWTGWESAIASLGLSELSGLVEDAFDRGFIDPLSVSRGDFREEMQAALSSPHDRRLAMLRVTPFGDTIEELSRWHGFSQEWISGQRNEHEDLDDIELLSAIESEEDFPLEPIMNPYRNIGRNDLCPCGSGKKFKRCCLGKAV
jgi:hypothetical protein